MIGGSSVLIVGLMGFIGLKKKNKINKKNKKMLFIFYYFVGFSKIQYNRLLLFQALFPGYIAY